MGPDSAYLHLPTKHKSQLRAERESWSISKPVDSETFVTGRKKKQNGPNDPSLVKMLIKYDIYKLLLTRHHHTAPSPSGGEGGIVTL